MAFQDRKLNFIVGDFSILSLVLSRSVGLPENCPPGSLLFPNVCARIKSPLQAGLPSPFPLPLPSYCTLSCLLTGPASIFVIGGSTQNLVLSEEKCIRRTWKDAEVTTP